MDRLVFINGGTESPQQTGEPIMTQNLATPVLHNVADAIANGVDPVEFVAAMHCNPMGNVWRNAEGVLLHDCGNCGLPRTTNGDCECQRR